MTNLEPCSGIRLHLWPEKGKSATSLLPNNRVVEVTSKMMRIPSGPAPRQVYHAYFQTILLSCLDYLLYYITIVEFFKIVLRKCLINFIWVLIIFNLQYYNSLNLAVRLSKLLHLLYFGWVLKICMASDFLLSQLHLIWYNFEFWLISF